jgi:peptide/nickel transport system substrate-binding protein
VRLVLKQPFRPLLSNLSSAYTGILDPRVVASGSDQCTNPIGSGPFKVAQVGPGFNTVTLVRNPLYTVGPSWSAHRGPAYLSSIIWKVVVSDSTSESELLTGALDIDSHVAGTQLPRVRGNPGITLRHSLEQDDIYLGFNLSHAPFNQPAVRRAVAEAIDRSALVAAAAGGLAVPAYSPIPASLPFYDPHAPRYAPKLDPADARRLIASARAGGPYTLLALAYPEFTTAAELIQAELAQVGLQVRIVAKPLADSLTMAAAGQFDLYLTGWGWPDPDFLYQILHSSQEKPGGLNFTFLHSPTLDNLIVAGRTAVTPGQAARAYAALQRYVDQQVIVDPLMTDELVAAVRQRVRGWRTTGNASGLPLFQDLYVSS